ncbi:predicted protein [Chaetomium globosum CBS 148.51]|uniref:C2H2-type domain-containing protein n=1 Tax=Chaetomium globosum (strain ATCC 6205 / CBS 148.51 / DSM 1962 / NBRC 6347 / NRRL 1970) TaxID=306901 RepID=Q2GWI8_CHAGB|nr:uncharacterized protein CHGG_07666 [Chaetomium globosum CBS 148.51]EAQ86413.1 predicted protein [Chaetomium globosum CBS 148.51]
MHNQSPLPRATMLSEPMLRSDFQLMSRSSATSPCLMPPPAGDRRLSCATGPGPPSDYQSVSGPDLATSPHYPPFGRSVVPAMNSPRDAYAFSSSPVPARGEASGTTASPLGSGVSFQYAQVQGYGNEDNCSELGSEPGNGRVSQETEDHYDPQSDDEPGDDSEERGAGSRTTHGPLNCPYRKRNRQRFNIRDHAKCTNPFKEFSHLKCAPIKTPRQKLFCVRTLYQGLRGRVSCHGKKSHG